MVLGCGLGVVATAPPLAGQRSVNDDTRPAVSPDGRRVVFQSRRLGRSQLFEMAAAGSYPRRRTHGLGNNENASFSPDGARIAFDSDRSGTWQIYVLEGDSSRALTSGSESARDPSFTADGAALLFVSPVDGVAQVHRVALDGGPPRTLTTSPGPKSEPVVSHDGRWLAYVTEGDGVREIRVLPFDRPESSPETVYRADGPRRFVDGLGWTPEGALVFATNRGEVGRYFYRTSVYTIERSGAALRRILTGPGNHGHPSLARDGSLLAFDAARFGGWDVFVVGPDGSGLRNLTATSRTEFFPVPLPGSDRVVFQSEREGQRDIYSMRRDGTDVRNLTDHPEDDRAPSVSADGSVVAFISFRDSPWGDVYTMTADGGSVTKVTPDGFFESLDQFGISTAITPDGRTILFESAPIAVEGEAHWDIWRIERDGTGARRLTDTPGTARSAMPAVAPDGRSFVFYSDRGGVRRVYRMSLDGGAPEAVTEDLRDQTFAGWTANGQGIYVTSLPDLYEVALDGSVVRRVGGGRGHDHFAPRASPDGREIWALGNEQGTTEIHRISVDGTVDVRVGAPWGPTGSDEPTSAACRGFTRLGQPHWSAGRNAIAFPGDCGGRHAIWVFDVATEELRALDTGGLDGVDSPRWSTRGDRLAFNALDASGERDMYVLDVDGGGVRRLTRGGAHGGWVTWSADDAWLNGYGQRENGVWDVLRIRVEDGSVRFLEGGGGDIARNTLAESPDGGLWLYASESRIWTWTEDGTPRAVTPGRIAAVMPRWAPDGRRYLFDGNDGSGWDLYIGTLDGAEPTRLTRRAELDSNASWSPEGSTVVFRCQGEGDVLTLCLVDVATRRARWLFAPDGAPAASPQLEGGTGSPASRRIAS